METTRLTSKGQVVIPKVIRESLQIKPGTEFKVTSDGTRIFWGSS
jgi:AbrB family looped-hinge helix DNA binding protein